MQIHFLIGQNDFFHFFNYYSVLPHILGHQEVQHYLWSNGHLKSHRTTSLPYFLMKHLSRQKIIEN